MPRIWAAISIITLVWSALGFADLLPNGVAEANMKRVQAIPNTQMDSVIAFQDAYWSLPDSMDVSARRAEAQLLVSQFAASNPRLLYQVLQEAGALRPGEVSSPPNTSDPHSLTGRKEHDLVAGTTIASISLAVLMTAIAWFSDRIEDWKLRRRTGEPPTHASRSPYVQIIWSGAAAWIAVTAWIAYR